MPADSMFVRSSAEVEPKVAIEVPHIWIDLCPKIKESSPCHDKGIVVT